MFQMPSPSVWQFSWLTWNTSALSEGVLMPVMLLSELMVPWVSIVALRSRLISPL
jgi:hypothetical protein